jgi:hypothetical protein
LMRMRQPTRGRAVKSLDPRIHDEGPRYQIMSHKTLGNGCVATDARSQGPVRVKGSRSNRALVSSGGFKFMSAVPPIPGMTVMDLSTYA